MQPLPGCPLDVVATLDLEALDDGPARPGSFAEVALDRPEDLPTIPSETRAFAVHGKGRDGSVTALGLLDVTGGRARGPLFPVDRACGLIDASGAPAPDITPIFGASIAHGGDRTVLAGGRGEDGAARSDLLVVDGRTGSVTRTGLRRRRAGAAVFVLGDRAIVAGGDGDSALWDDAETLDLASDSLASGPSIGLSEPRADAGAVVLSSGLGLLVGGRGQKGAIGTLEIVDPNKPIGSTLDLGHLAKPRIAPVVVRLSTGHVAVLGGHDAAGPVADIELFEPSARSAAIVPFAAAEQLDAIALPSGAMLVVSSSGAGKTALTLVRLDGIESLGTIPSGTRAPRLLAGTDGAPFLFDGTFRRYDPWTFTFATSPLPLEPHLRTDPFVLDSGLVGALHPVSGGLAWTATRYDVRSSLVVDAETLGLGATAHLCPDRTGARVDRDGLVLPPSARVAVTDATFRGVSVRAFARGRELPAIELRTPLGELVVRVDEDGACAYPKGDGDFAELVRENDGTISVTIGDAKTVCTPVLTTNVRVAVSLVAGTREARMRGVAVSRR
ncbi:MAG: hypothetical protein ACXVEF_06940 [Polyangiales bacterium]